MMSTDMFSLEQVCKEHLSWQASVEPGRFAPSDTSSSDSSAPVGTSTRLHNALLQLTATLTHTSSLEEMLQSVTSLTREALGVDLCVILLQDPLQHHFKVRAWTPDLSAQDVDVRTIQEHDDLCERLRPIAVDAQPVQLTFLELEELNPLKNVQYETLLPVPLLVNDECIGLLHAYTSKAHYYSAEDLLLLATIAGQTALAIKHLQYRDDREAAQRTAIRQFVNELCSTSSTAEDDLLRRAYTLGYDLTQPHLVVLLEVCGIEGKHAKVATKEERFTYYEALLRRVCQSIVSKYPGSLLDERRHTVLCLLRLPVSSTIEAVSDWLEQLTGWFRHDAHACLLVGIGRVCLDLRSYPRGYAEAQQALEVGRYLHRDGGCSDFAALGAYRYLYKFACEDRLCDQYQEQITRIVEYDRRKRTNLLDTLDIYLECGGNIARAASQLNLHRNTLLQRIERLHKLCTLDIEQLPHRLPLLIALKVYRLRTA